MVEREIAEVDDATFPLASARLVGGTFRLSGTVESLGRGEYRGLRMRVLIELSVTKVLSYELDDTSGGGALIHESAEPFDGGTPSHRRDPAHLDSIYDGTVTNKLGRK